MAVGIDAKLVELSWQPGTFDLQLDANGDIATEDSFDSAIFCSLFTDRRASSSQIALPELRRGWIGDERTPGFQMGSVLWLYEMSRLNRTTANGIEDAAVQALGWMVDEGYAVAVEADMTLEGPEQGTLEIRLTKPTGEVETRLWNLWALTGMDFGGAA